MLALIYSSVMWLFVASQSSPFVVLHNAAQHNVEMPVIGLGTGGYAPNSTFPHGEYWNDSVAEVAVAAWLRSGGRRIDTGLSYHDQVGIGRAIKHSGIAREEIFITSKTGPSQGSDGNSSLPSGLGYKDTLDQMESVLSTLNVSYVDLLLIHWPYYPSHPPSSDPRCNGVSYAELRVCRQETWRAMQELFKQKKARAIGVSNFEVKHLQDILDMKEMIPSVNQCEFHPYWHEFELVKFCQKINITFNGYAPLGTPDYGPWSRHWNSTILELPLVRAIAKAQSKTPAQVLIRYSIQHGVVVNPRSWTVEHMKENLDVFDFKLTEREITQLDDLPKPSQPKVCPDPNDYP